MTIPLIRYEAVSAATIHEVLDSFPNVRFLSLDCFDTLIWRRVREPIDVFYKLCQHDLFRSNDITPSVRIRAESLARKTKLLTTGTSEVSLRDIYSAINPSYQDQLLSALVNQELECEKSFCFAWPPILSLIGRAISKNIKVVIASDTYFSAVQLRELICFCMPNEKNIGITHFFCSTDYGISKSQGLLNSVLKEIGTDGSKVLHIGDNEVADFGAAKSAKINGIHMTALSADFEEQERLSDVATMIIEGGIRSYLPLYAPYRPVLSQKTDIQSDPELTSYALIGPVVYGFCKWLKAEVESLKWHGENVKLIFLLRDSYLLLRAWKELKVGYCDGLPVRLSRFTAYAATFRSKSDVIAYLANFDASSDIKIILRQLLLEDHEISKISVKAVNKKTPWRYLLNHVLSDAFISDLVDRSKAYSERLKRALEDQVDMRSGDTLVLVDVGYEGTVQRLLGPVAQREWGVTLVGRYMVSARTQKWSVDRAAFIGPDKVDDRALSLLIRYMGVWEALFCTLDQSVINYSNSGQALLEEGEFSVEHMKVVSAIQAAAIEFVNCANEIFSAIGEPEIEALRQSAIGRLLCLSCLPTQRVRSVLGNLTLNLGLGAGRNVKMLNPTGAEKALRARGLNFMQRLSEDRGLLRIAELNSSGLEFSISTLLQERLALQLPISMLTAQKLQVPVQVMRSSEVIDQVLVANKTVDGWYSLIVPVGTGDFRVFVLAGKLFSVFKQGDITLCPQRVVNTDKEDDSSILVTDVFKLVGGEAISENIFKLSSPEGGFIISVGSDRKFTVPQVVRVVFKPL